MKKTPKGQYRDSLSLEFLNETLFEYEFKRVDFVTEAGEFSVRGGIVDVFSFSNDKPFRIEFFGDEIDSIRTFDIESQLSIDKLSQITIIPNVAGKSVAQNRVNFLEFIGENAIVFLEDIDTFGSKMEGFYDKALDHFDKLDSEVAQLHPRELFLGAGALKDALKQNAVAYIPKAMRVIHFRTYLLV